MWICHNEGFVSIVADRNNKDRLLVRARREEDLKSVLKPILDHVEIFSDTGSDYKWRAFVPRTLIATVVMQEIMKIDYDNFKNSVEDHDLHDLYHNMWGLHYDYQRRDPATTGRRR